MESSQHETAGPGPAGTLGASQLAEGSLREQPPPQADRDCAGETHLCDSR